MLESALKWDELIWDKWGGLGFKLGLAKIGCDGLLIGEHFLKCNFTAGLIHLQKRNLNNCNVFTMMFQKLGAALPLVGTVDGFSTMASNQICVNLFRILVKKSGSGEKCLNRYLTESSAKLFPHLFCRWSFGQRILQLCPEAIICETSSMVCTLKSSQWKDKFEKLIRWQWQVEKLTKLTGWP